MRRPEICSDLSIDPELVGAAVDLLLATLDDLTARADQLGNKGLMEILHTTATLLSRQLQREIGATKGWDAHPEITGPMTGMG